MSESILVGEVDNVRSLAHINGCRIFSTNEIYGSSIKSTIEVKFIWDVVIENITVQNSSQFSSLLGFKDFCSFSSYCQLGISTCLDPAPLNFDRNYY